MPVTLIIQENTESCLPAKILVKLPKNMKRCLPTTILVWLFSTVITLSR